MATQSVPGITEEEYVRLESAAEYKSEFVDGQMFAMAGGSYRHSQLAMNWGAEFLSRLRGRGCRIYGSDAKILTNKTGAYLYPDVWIACGSAVHLLSALFQ